MSEPAIPTPPTEVPPALGVAEHTRCVAGQSAQVHVNVRNESSSTRVIVVALVGLDPEWLPDPVRTSPVSPGETVTVALPVAPTRGTLAADYPGAVTAQAVDPGTGLATSRPGVADVVFTVSPRPQLQLKVTPAELPTRWRARFTVQVRNTGEERAEVNLSVTEPHGARIKLSSARVQVAPHSTLQVRAAARLRRPRLFGWVGQHRFSVSALGSDIQASSDGLVLQNPVVPPFLAKALAIVTTLALWASMAMVFLPEFGQWVRSSQDRADSVAQKRTDASGETDGSGSAGEGSGESPGGESDGDRAGEGSGDDGSEGGGAGKGNTVTPASNTRTLQLSGTVAGDRPDGVSIRLEPTSLVDEEAQGGIGIGVPETQLASSGLRLASAMSRVSSRKAEPVRLSETSADGSYSFAGVRAPGYYLMTFTKPGFQTRKYVIDSTSEAAKQPLEVPLAPGEGRLSGTVTGAKGGVGGVKITISDGTHTVSTSSNSKGNVGAWSLEGLSTPSAYVVQASTHNLSTEARLVQLGAGGSATADLRLSAGVATLTGRITHEGDDGKESGLGGATVTVSNGAGVERTATTLTQGQVGWYTIPGLSAPGNYTVTLAAPGYGQRTTQLVLAKGQSTAKRSALLTSSASTLSGRVTGPDGGLVAAGMVLTNAENTYKTTSTSSPEAGAYRFNGVAPGTYTLTTTMFGLTTDRVTVTLASGRTKIINRSLETQAGGVIPNTAVIVGQVLDARTNGELRPCTSLNPYTPRCVKAEVDDTDPTTDDVTTYRTEFEPTEQYRLPRVGASGGLRPGLHTVRVSSPGYVIADVDVQVARGQTSTAPDLKLQPAPVISGQVRAEVGTFADPINCVYVLKGADQSAPSRQDCSTAIEVGAHATSATDASTACYPETARWEAVDFNQSRFCAATTAAGDYSVQVPDAGTYTVVVVPTDREYVAKASNVVVAAGDSRAVNPRVDRLGRLLLRVVAPGSDNTLRNVGGVTVSVSPSTDFAIAETDDDGLVTISGLNGSYTFSAASDRQSGSLTRTVGLNAINSTAVRLPLDKAAPSLLGRVTSNVFGTPEPVTNAVVKVEVATGLPSAVPQPLSYTPVTVATDSRGCFEIKRTGDAPRTTATCHEVQPDSSANPDAVAEVALASSRVKSVKISAPGYENYPIGITPDPTTNLQFSTDVEAFTLVPKRVPFAGTATATHPIGDWADASVSVAVTSGSSGPVTGSLSGSGTSSTLTLTDTEVPNPANQLRPGKYTVTVTHPDFAKAEADLVCAVAQACSWATEAPELRKYGTVRVALQSGNGVPVLGAVATLDDGSSEHSGVPDTAQPEIAVFTNVVPNAAQATATPNPRMIVKVNAAGHAFGTNADGAITLACPGGSDVVLPPGETVDCVGELVQRGSVSGTVVGVVQGAAGPTDVALGGATVTASKCDDPDCTTLVEPAETFTTTSSSVAGAEGSYTVTGSTTIEGLSPGTWAIHANRAGYVWAGANPHGVPVTVGVGATTNQRLPLTPIARTVTVTVQTANGTRVSGATVTQHPTAPANAAAVATAVEVPDLVGVYQFTAVGSGWWRFTAAKSDYQVTSIQAEVTSGSSVQVLAPIIVSPRAGGLSGVATVDGAALPDVEIKVQCQQGHTGTVACPSHSEDTVAVSSLGNPLVRTTDAAGGYAFDDVPPGTYTLVATRRGYTSTPSTTFTVLATGSQWNPALTQIRSNVKWTLTNAGGGTLPALTGSKVELTPTEGPATPPLSIATGTSITLPWGCYSMSVQLPTGVRGGLGVLNGAPQDPTLGCAADQLTVPVSAPMPQINLTQQLTSRKLTVDLDTTPQAGRTTGPVTVQIKRGNTTVDTIAPATTGSWVWLPPGQYAVTASLSQPSPFWTSDSANVNLNGGDGTATLELEEQAAEVTVNLPGAGTVTVSAVDPADTPPPTLSIGASGQGSLQLASGTWLITGTWATGSDATQITISSLGDRTVTFSNTLDPEVGP